MITCPNCKTHYSFREFEAIAPIDDNVTTCSAKLPDGEALCESELLVPLERYEQFAKLYNATSQEDGVIDAVLASRDGDVEDALNDLGDRWWGIHDSPSDWAEDILTSCGIFEDVDKTLVMYFDFEAYARDAELGGEYNFIPIAHGKVAVTSNR